MIDIFFFIICISTSVFYPTGIEPLWYSSTNTLIGVLLNSFLYAFIPLFFKFFRVALHRRIFFIWRLFIIVFFVIDIYILHWLHFVSENICSSDTIFFYNFFFILPLILKIFLLWITQSIVEGKIWVIKKSYFANFLFQFKFFVGLVLFPYLILQTAGESLIRINFLRELLSIYNFLNWICLIIIIFLMFLIAPFWLKFIFRAKSLKIPALREELESFSRKIGFTYRDIVVVKTSTNLANAFIVGLFPSVRYVFFTDALLNALNIEQIKSVFAHEVGHAMHNHLFLYFLLAISVIISTIFVGTIIEDIFPELIIVLISFSIFIIMFLYIFIFISRRFERQADFYAVLTTSPQLFQNSLIKIAEVNGISLYEKSLRHHSIIERINFINTLFENEQISPIKAGQFIQKMQKVAYQIAIFVTFGIVFMAITAIYDFFKSPSQKFRLDREMEINNLKKEAYDLASNKKYEEAVEKCKDILLIEENDKYAYLLLAEIQGELGMTQEAWQNIYEIEKKGGFKELKYRLALKDLKNKLNLTNTNH